jgi:hypothetical protein
MLIWHKFVLFLVPTQEKVGESKEPRFPEDEGFYVGIKPNLGEHIITAMIFQLNADIFIAMISWFNG